MKNAPAHARDAALAYTEVQVLQAPGPGQGAERNPVVQERVRRAHRYQGAYAMNAVRVGNWRHERASCSVYIGRGSKWGNPFVSRGRAKRSRFAVTEVDDPLEAYEAHVRARPELMAALLELRGQTLGCYCVSVEDSAPESRDDETCHGHVLARLVREVANG